jgi:hypothetical protein
MTHRSEHTSPSGHVRHHRTYWWKEALIMGVFYLIYSWARNQFGSANVSDDAVPLQAFNNALRVIRLERAMGLFHEETVQEWFLSYDWFIQFMNTYYGTMHFLITVAVFVILYRRRPDVFPQWRNTLAATTALAIVGFSLFPLMPPRLLDEPCPPKAYGGACIESTMRSNPNDGEPSFGFVDTLKEYGGPWSFDSGTMEKISNQFAAMPSLHIGWASWCAFALWPLARKRWVRAAFLLYPALTLLCIVVTANHFWLDGVGGQLALGLGFLIGTGIHRFNQARLDRELERLYADT